MLARCWLLMALLCCMVWGASCGDSAGALEGLPIIPARATTPPVVSFPARSFSLEQTLSELEALTTPAGVEPEVFAELKAELTRVLRLYYAGDAELQVTLKQASDLSPEQMNQAWCLQGRVAPNGQATLSWRGRHLGDYDLNGEVNISDITPLGMFYKESEELDADGLPVVNGQNEWKAQVDGDSNTEINISDITPIGVNFASQLSGYRVYWGTSANGTDFTWQPQFLPNPAEPAAPVSVAFNAETAAGQVLKYTFSFSAPAAVAGQKSYVKVVPFDGTAEGSATIIPLYEGPHAAFECGVCHRVTDLAFKGIEAACQACHNTPPENTSAVWIAAPGMHGQCLTCHTAHGFSITPPEAVCGMCHAKIASEVEPSGMGACLGCHQTPHLPAAAPAVDTCKSCHVNPDNDAGKDWAAAVGQHGQCFACHTTHAFSIGEPNAICAGCHADRADGTHSGGSLDCLSCHGSPHLPEKSAAGMNCISCHPVPPDRPEKTWADAPGTHAMCIMCHLDTHGNKPVPPESICGNCHGTLLAAHAPDGMACIDCHQYYHVPEADHTNTGCIACHPVPPEKPAAAWNDAPGQHADCLLCHPGQHPDKPAPPDAICVNCHPANYGDAHAVGTDACLDCHSFVHLPEYDLQGEECMVCHVDYVGDGNHLGSCLDCHDGTVHPGADPWEACSDCHQY